jgi:hypothetical protein
MAFSCFSVIFVLFYNRPAPYPAQSWLYSAARLPFAKLAVCCISLALGHICLFYPAQRVRPLSTVSVRTAASSSSSSPPRTFPPASGFGSSLDKLSRATESGVRNPFPSFLQQLCPASSSCAPPTGRSFSPSDALRPSPPPLPPLRSGTSSPLPLLALHPLLSILLLSPHPSRLRSSRTLLSFPRPSSSPPGAPFLLPRR